MICFFKELRPSELVHVPEDEILVLGFDDHLPLGVGVLRIRFSGTLNDQMKGFYRRYDSFVLCQFGFLKKKKCPLFGE